MSIDNIALFLAAPGQWVYLETCGIVRVVAVDHYDGSVDIFWSAWGSADPAIRSQPMTGMWSGRHEDFLSVRTYSVNPYAKAPTP